MRAPLRQVHSALAVKINEMALLATFSKCNVCELGRGLSALEQLHLLNVASKLAYMQCSTTSSSTDSGYLSAAGASCCHLSES